MTKTATPTPEQIEDLRLGAVGIRRWMPEALPANEQGQVHFARALAEAAAEAIEAVLPSLAASPPTAVEPVKGLDAETIAEIHALAASVGMRCVPHGPSAPPTAVEPVVVKPLEWLSDRWPFFAQTPFCRYNIRPVDDDTGPHWETAIGYLGSTYRRSDTEAAAKAAAQADYETRIRSALATPSTELRTAVEPVAVPFMYGIACPDGWAYFDEHCVDGDRYSLETVIEEQELEGHHVVPLYATPPASTDLREENERLKAGIKRLSDEEEYCAEVTGEDPFQLVYLSAKLASTEARAATLSAENERLREALTEIASSWAAHGYSDAMDAVQAMKEAATEALNAER